MSKLYFVVGTYADKYGVYDVLFTVKKTQRECTLFMERYNRKVTDFKRENKALLRRRGHLYGKLNGSLSMNERISISKTVNIIDKQLEEKMKKRKDLQMAYSMDGGCSTLFRFDGVRSTYVKPFTDEVPMEIL